MCDTQYGVKRFARGVVEYPASQWPKRSSLRRPRYSSARRGVVRALLDGLPDTWLDTPDTADGWTPRDVVGQLISAELDDWILRAEVRPGATAPTARSSRSIALPTSSATLPCCFMH